MTTETNRPTTNASNVKTVAALTTVADATNVTDVVA